MEVVMRNIQTVLKSSAGLFASAALLLALAGCQRIELQGEGQQGTSEQGTSEQGATEQGAVEFSAEEFELTASIAEEQDRTKFSLDEDANRYLQPRWSVGDIVAAWDASGNTYGLTVKSVTSGGRSATMGLITSGTGKGSKTTVSSGTKLYLVSFPGVTASNVSSKTLTITLNAQTSDAIPLMASGTVGSGGRMPVIFDRAGTVLSLKNITNLKASTTYTRLGVSGCGNQIQFAIGSSGEIQASYPSSTGNALKTVSATTTSSGTLAGPLYIVVPPVSSADLQIDCTSSDDATSSIIMRSCTFAAGHHYYVDNVTFSRATTGSAAVNSTAGRTSCRWVQLWENGPKWAEFNVGATITSYEYESLSKTADSGSTWEDGENPTDETKQLYCTANVGGLYAWGTPATNARTNPWPYVQEHISPGDDVATSLWGDNWQTPDRVHINNLVNRSDSHYDLNEEDSRHYKYDFDELTGDDILTVWTWCDGSTTQYVPGCTLKGYKISGKSGTVYQNNCIFLPAAGFYICESYMLGNYQTGISIHYWSSTVYGSGGMAYDIVYNNNHMGFDEYKRGLSVRAVLKE